MTFEELKGIVESLAATVVAHDNQIDGLIRVAEQQRGELSEMRKLAEQHTAQILSLERQWQAYINTLPRQ